MEDQATYFGEVCWFNAKKGYGFIIWSIEGTQQNDIFCHFSDITMEGFKTLFKDQQVSFQLGRNHHGDLKAVNIKIIS
jgi:CspA family cold shock protein